jgi:methionyl-tRNA formyltransferase
MTRSLIFFGSDQYSAVVLDALIHTPDVALVAVVTDRGKPKDRDQHIEPGPVERLAIMHSLKVCYYPSNIDEMNKFTRHLQSSILNLKSNQSPVGLCASFDHLLPREVIELFAGELYNLHPSLLPQYRNVSPVQYALALGDSVTGITLFRISAGIDNGEIIAQASEVIESDDTTPVLTHRLFHKGAKLFSEYIRLSGSPTLQPSEFSDCPDPIFTHRLTRESGYVEWPVFQKLITDESVSPEGTKNELLSLRLESDLKGSAQPEQSEGRSDHMGPQILHDLLRALTPWPGVWTVAETRKGELRLSLESVSPLRVKIAGKPSAIPWSDFTKYYLHA